MADSGEREATEEAADPRERLLAENRSLAQRYLELEESTRKQIDKLRAANEVLSRGESHMRLLLENAEIGFVLLDLGMRVVSANNTLAQILGYSHSELTGEDFAGYVYVADLPAFNRLAGVSGARTETTGNMELLARNGSLVPCRMTVSDWMDDKGAARGLFILVFNLGEEKRWARRLHELETRFVEMGKTRKMFLEVISRELRTPASGIMGMIRMLMDDDLSDRQAELAGVIHSSASSLVRLVDDLVDIARLDSDDLRLNPRPFRVGELAQGAADFFLVRAEEKGLELIVAVSPAVPEVVLADAERLRRVLAHLLDNALKFTDHGRVTLSVDLVGDTLRFMVSDTGRGLAVDLSQDIFSEYQVADSAAARRQGGAGLGLSICRRLVNLMGGKIGYETEAGRGSEFHFAIPLVVPDRVEGEETAALPPEAIRLQPMSILLADGNPMTRRIARAYLQFDGHRLTEVENGLEAVSRCRAGQFDLAVLDLQLSKLDGLQTLRLIRDEEKVSGRRRLPVLVLGASGQIRDDAYYARAGADGVLRKPFLPVELMAAVASAAGVKTLAVAREEAPGAYAAEASGGSLRRIDGAQLVNVKQVMLDEQFLGLLRFFMEDAIPDIVDMQAMAAAPEPDRERIAFAANKAKGLAGYLGFAALAEMLNRVEGAACEEVEAQELHAMADELTTVVDDTLEELKRIMPEAFATLSTVGRGEAPEGRPPGGGKAGQGNEGEQGKGSHA